MKKLMLVSGALAASMTFAGDWYVKTGGDDGADGKGWATAVGTIGCGLGKAADGDVVWVEDGYVSGSDLTPATGQSMISVPAGVTLRSQSGFVDEAEGKGAKIRGYVSADALDETAGKQNQSGGCRRGVQLGAGAKLIGFVVENGASPGYGKGGGVLGANLTCVVSNCVVRGNIALYGGGGLCAVTAYSTVVSNNVACHEGGGAKICDLHDCTIAGNLEQSPNNDAGGGGCYNCNVYGCRVIGNRTTSYGGGIRANTGSNTDYAGPYVCTNTIICGNTANRHGAVDISGTAVMPVYDSPSICSNRTTTGTAAVGTTSFVRCRVFGHRANQQVLGNGRFIGCVIEDNWATNAANTGFGSTCYTNCIIRNNRMDYAGGTSIYGFISNGGGTIVNCVITNNEMLTKGALSGSRNGLVAYDKGTVIGCYIADNRCGYLFQGNDSYAPAHAPCVVNSLVVHEDALARCVVSTNSTFVRTAGSTGYACYQTVAFVNSISWNAVGQEPKDYLLSGTKFIGVENSCTAYPASDTTGRSFKTDPMLDFDATGKRYLMPMKGSPCIDACADSSFDWMTLAGDPRAKDVYGRRRVLGTSADIGAVEYKPVYGLKVLFR